MASKSDRNPENVPGKYYCDSQCINCGACRATAPDFFAAEETKGYSYVKAQPTDAASEALCREALDGCPVGAIGSDGV
jgi:ferredoxin